MPWGGLVQWEPDYLIIRDSNGDSVEFQGDQFDTFIDAILQVVKARSYSTERPAR